MKKNSRLVYSTESGRIKPASATPTIEPSDGIVRIFREKRKGSGISLIKGLPANVDSKALAKQLKQKLGVGGSVKHNTIELQTDQREAIKALLAAQGLQVKIAGG